MQVSNSLKNHRICNADYGRVACYCSAMTWMSLDEYGEHIESIAGQDNTVTILVDRSRIALCEWCKKSVTEPGCIFTGQVTTDGTPLMSHVFTTGAEVNRVGT